MKAPALHEGEHGVSVVIPPGLTAVVGLALYRLAIGSVRRGERLDGRVVELVQLLHRAGRENAGPTVEASSEVLDL